MTARILPFDGGDPHGIVDTPNNIVEHASAVLLAKDIADILERNYPGWAWAVETDPRGGVVNIRSLKLSGEWGNIIKMAWLNDPGTRRKLILDAGGEILERFGMPVGPYNYERWANGPRDIAGHPKPDLSDKHTRIQRHHRDHALTRAVRQGDVEIRVDDTTQGDMTHRRILIAGTYRSREDVSS